jgi:hypothetical protein
MNDRYSIFLVVTILVFYGCAVKHDVPKPRSRHRPVPLTGLPSEPPPTEQEYKNAVNKWASQHAEDCAKKLGEKVSCVVQSISKPTYTPDRFWCVMVVILIGRTDHADEAIITKKYLQETIAMKIKNGKAQPYSSNMPRCN